MLSKSFNRKQTTQTFLVNNERCLYILTVFEPKEHFRGSYRTDALPLSQSATFNSGNLALYSNSHCI